MMESGETLLNWLGNRGGSLSFLVGTISNILVMEIGWTDVGSGGYILVSCAHSNNNCVLISAVPSHDGKGEDVEMCIVIMPTDRTTG